MIWPILEARAKICQRIFEDLKTQKIYSDINWPFSKDNNAEDDFHLSLADDEDEADDDTNFNPLNKTNSNVAQATPSLESGT